MGYRRRNRGVSRGDLGWWRSVSQPDTVSELSPATTSGEAGPAVVDVARLALNETLYEGWPNRPPDDAPPGTVYYGWDLTQDPGQPGLSSAA